MIQFSDKEIYEAVENNLHKVSSYVGSHGGGITLLGSKNATVYIELIGTCSGCAMSLMTTKMVVQKELRALIHPELNVVNVDGTAENILPDNVYSKSEELEDITYTTQESVLDKVRDFLHI